MSKQIVAAAELGVNQSMLDPDALEVIQKLQNNGFAAYIVGGGIRDLLLGKKPKDYDIVSDATPEQVRRVFGRNSMIIGRRFKIVHVYFEHLHPERTQKAGRPRYERHIIEVSTYRSNQVNHHSLSEHGRILVDNNYGTIDEDAFRRDFTVNALYYDPLAEVIIDYHNGLNDIAQGVLRVIGNAHDRYLEDPVRVLRAIRLSEKLNLTIDEDTYINFRNAKHLLLNEPRGRLFEEMLKILMSGDSLRMVEELKELGLPRRVFPLFDKLFFQAQPLDFALKVLAKTDARVSGGEDVSLIFILSGLAWEAVYLSWQAELENGVHLRQGLLNAISKNKMVIFNSGITRNLYASVREIWMLQIDFEFPNLSKIEHLVSHNRFRQAWHLYDLRHEFAQVGDELHAWWQRFMEASDEERTELLIEVVDLIPLEPKLPKKRRKPRRRNKNKAQLRTQES